LKALKQKESNYHFDYSQYNEIRTVTYIFISLSRYMMKPLKVFRPAI